MLDWFQVLAADVVQVDLLVFCLVQLADKRNVVATNDEHSMLQHFNARVWGVHPLLALLQNNVDHLVEPSEGPNQMSAVTCDDRHGLVAILPEHGGHVHNEWVPRTLR
eukprot:TRINITY_DN8250_c0_g1_i4.p2 TRINITY_DN8250_c0_g1~~TRINITY_DN8250_c0_g1_i4.p2  ORF type:complete len:108 (-),score=16.20 TRINITY_DN8250_c0_g1_i4:171-494(-)